VSYDNLGDLDRTEDAKRARRSFEKSLAIREQLAKPEPGNTTFLRDLSVSYDKLGDLDRTEDAKRAQKL